MSDNEHVKTVNGKVLDNKNGINNIEIYLYRVVQKRELEDGPTVYLETFYGSTRTSKDGGFYFIVPEGDYSLAVNIDSLPDGKTVLKKDYFLEKSVHDLTINLVGKELEKTGGSHMPERPQIKKDAIDIIRSDYRNGVINREQMVRNILYSIFDKSKLAEKYTKRRSIPIKCATTALEEIREYSASRYADPALASEARRYISNMIPSLEKSYISKSGNFKIFYTTEGRHAVSLKDSNRNGVPDYIEDVAYAMENVRTVTCGQRGFKYPLLGGKNSYYKVYLYDLDGIYGYTASSYKRGYGSRVTSSSFLALDNNYSSKKGFEISRNAAMKVTAAHEYFHAVQYAYNMDADKWWKEASATWNEDELYSSVNDYFRYIDDIFEQPNKSLDEYTYSGVVFAKYITEYNKGYESMKRIWEIQNEKTDNSINAIDRFSKEGKNKSIGDIFNRFSAYNFNPSQYYEEGRQWDSKLAVQNTYEQYPVFSRNNKLDHLAADYQLFKLSGVNSSNVRITVEGISSIKWGFKLQKKRKSDGRCDTTYIELGEAANRAEIILKKAGQTYSEICLIPANLDKSKDGASYDYSLNIE